MQINMNKNWIENPNSNNELDCKSSSTIRTNPARRTNSLLNQSAKTTTNSFYSKLSP